MNELNVQIAELLAPFPAKAFEKELLENGIRFREMSRTNGDGGVPSIIYYIGSEDVEKTLIIREKVERENAALEIKHLYPIRKILAYIALFLIGIYLIFELVQIFTSEY